MLHTQIAITHEAMIGMHIAYGQFITDSRRGSLCCTVWERKLVRTEYSETRVVLYWEKRPET